MPRMYEIYERHSHEYDELVRYEDHRQNLKKLLQSLVDWENKTVIEAGIGTGRVTHLYVEKVKRVYGLDRSPHMLEGLKKNLSSQLYKIELLCADNLHLTELSEKGDIFIEGWSFGHTISDNENNIDETTRVLVEQSIRMTKEDGLIIFIETLGSNSEIAKAPKESLSKFYYLIENKFGFIRHEIRIDYKFPSVEEAARITGFFFGNDFGENILRTRKAIVPEWTGVWVLDKKKIL
jgi:ubiquinone/menaquinone biosynthesis C-methylase UbiE